MTVSKKKSWYEIRAAATEDTGGDERRAEVLLYDEIGIWGVTATMFTAAISELDVDVIDLRINSPGGSVFDGMAIMNALRRHPARIEVTVDGLAASAASFIAMAGERVVMNQGAQLMVHDAWGYAEGNEQTMQEMADSLGKISQAIAGIYAKRAGGTVDEWRKVMLAETWYSAEEAVAAGLADESADAPAAENSFDLSRYHFQGRAAAPGPGSSLSAVEPGGTTNEEDGMDFRALLVERLGLAAEATDDEIVAALDEALAASDAANNEGGDGGGDPAAQLPDGVVAIDADVLAALQGDAAAGREALNAQASERREGIVRAAIADGRIAPKSADRWRTSLERDEEGASALLADLATNKIPVAEIGKSDGVRSADDELYDNAWGKKEGVA